MGANAAVDFGAQLPGPLVSRPLPLPVVGGLWVHSRSRRTFQVHAADGKTKAPDRLRNLPELNNEPGL